MRRVVGLTAIQGYYAFLLRNVVARPDNILNTCPRLNADIRRVWLMPKQKIRRKIKINLDGFAGFSVSEYCGARFKVFENQCVYCEIFFVKWKSITFLYNR